MNNFGLSATIIRRGATLAVLALLCAVCAWPAEREQEKENDRKPGAPEPRSAPRTAERPSRESRTGPGRQPAAPVRSAPDNGQRNPRPADAGASRPAEVRRGYLQDSRGPNRGGPNREGRSGGFDRPVRPDENRGGYQPGNRPDARRDVPQENRGGYQPGNRPDARRDVQENRGGYQPGNRPDARPDVPQENRGGYQPGNRPDARRDVPQDTRGGYQPGNRPDARRDVPQENRGGYQPGNRPDARRDVPQENRGRYQPDNWRNRQNEAARGGYGERRPAPMGVVRGRDGRIESYRGRSGSEARFRPDGSLHTVRAHGMMIVHGPARSRRIVVERPGHTVVVANRFGHGYVQRPFAYRGHDFVHRTYYVNGHAYARFYRPYRYRGIELHSYVPLRYYPPAFYGWAYHPWRTPMRYRWAWVDRPWFAYYGGYFRPAPVYLTASVWLADYLIAARLQEDYEERIAAQQQAAAYAAQQPPPQPAASAELSPEVRDAIAAEVQRQLALENSEGQNMSRQQLADPASSGLPRMLADNRPHVFLVSSNLDVIDGSGQFCAVSRGDVLRLSPPVPPEATAAQVQVVAAKGQGCPLNSTVSVGLDDLQDMHNQMREQLDGGLTELRDHAGQGGVPQLPPSASAAPQQAAFADIAPPPDPDAAGEISQEVKNADQIEQEVVKEAGSAEAQSPQASPAAPQPAAGPLMGQSVDEVLASYGDPLQIIDLGEKKIYRYSDMKVTFVSGKVAGVQ